MATQSHNVAPDLWLVRNTLHQPKPEDKKVVEIPTNHFAIIDCSGSMYYDLPKIREQLKKKLPKLLKEKDTISIIWFSGRGQFGTLIEGEPVASLTDLQDVERAIDRWLKPVGLTGFKEPLEEAGKVVDRVVKANPNSVASLFFMSDGCDNQWSRQDILKATEQAAKGFASATFVEYGYYADRPLLTSMAEKSGGALIFAEQFDKYAPMFEAALQKKLSGAPKVEVKLEGDAIEGFAFSLSSDGDILTYAVEGGKILVPEDLTEVCYLSPSSVGEEGQNISQNPMLKYVKGTPKFEAAQSATAAAYAATSLYATRMKPKVVLPLLKALGDVRFIEQFSTCFGKQAYSAFQDDVKAAAFDPKLRLTEGWDPNKVPAEDAFTALDLLYLLSGDDSNRVLLDHPSFSYNRIGRGRVDASDQLTEAEQEEIRELTSKLGTLKKASEIKKINERIAEISNNKPDALKFEATPAPDGYSIASLTFNESRPNVSILVKKAGTVDISSRLPDEHKGKIPEVFDTFIYRNYAIIKDGLINVDKLPVQVSHETYRKLVDEGVPMDGAANDPNPDRGVEVILNLRGLPVVNQQMVKDVSAKSFFETQYALSVAQAKQKVYNSFSKELLPEKKSEGWAAKYGDDGTAWLKEQGFTEWSGFSPKSVQAEVTDFYMGKELKVNLKGLSSLPSLNDVRKQIAKGKLNAGGTLMAPIVSLVEGFLDSDAYKAAADQDAVLKAWLEGQTKAAREEARGFIYLIAQTTFALVVGQTWFTEFASLDENSLDIEVDGGAKIACKVEMKEIEVKI